MNPPIKSLFTLCRNVFLHSVANGVANSVQKEGLSPLSLFKLFHRCRQKKIAYRSVLSIGGFLNLCFLFCRHSQSDDLRFCFCHAQPSAKS